MTPVAEFTPQTAYGVALAPQPAPNLELDPEREYEIVNGQPEVKDMAGALHGGVTARLIGELWIYLKQSEAGSIYTPDTTFTIGKNERLPDIGFVSAERFPEEGEPNSKWEIVPDLAIEVISPNDIWDKVNQKRRDYFAAGVREVWLISLEGKEAELWTSPATPKVVGENDDLASETLLPGFRCRLGDLFQLPVRRSAPLSE
jgi:Uma2 family endonuclease